MHKPQPHSVQSSLCAEFQCCISCGGPQCRFMPIVSSPADILGSIVGFLLVSFVSFVSFVGFPSQSLPSEIFVLFVRLSITAFAAEVVFTSSGVRRRFTPVV